MSDETMVIITSLNVVTDKFALSNFLFLSIASPKSPEIMLNDSIATTKLIAPIYLGKK